MASTVSFHTLGCKLNFSETATVARQFSDRGFDILDFKEQADVYVINTCSVTENADRKCRKIVKQALKINPDAFIIVMGCYAQLKPQEIARIPGVDAVLGAAEKFRLFDLLNDFEKQHLTQIHRCQIEETQTFIPSHTLEGRTRAFLKVQDGCDYKCSFCTIPLARGISRSVPTHEILAEARKLEAEGIQEIVLTGVNIGDYGKVHGETFFDLIRLLDQELKAIPRIRISSIEPNLLSDEIIRFVAESERFMPHFHIPLQSGCNKILRLMRRRYVRELYRDRVELIKSVMPDACIGCDVIVGFPSETEADFEETHAFIHEIPITYLHVFPFSERSNTLADTMPDQVPQAVRYERGERLRQLSMKKRHFFNQSFQGQEKNVLFENEVENGIIFGWTDNYLRVGTPFEEGLLHRIVPVRIGESLDDELVKGDIMERVEI